MARTAKSEGEEQDIVELIKPDYERAINVLSNDVHPAEEKNASSRGDLSAAWKIIEDECHVNKGAAKLYYKLAGMSDEKRDDFLRSLYGMMETGGMGISADLVDRMETDGEVPRMPVEGALADVADEDEPEAPPKKTATRKPKDGLATLEAATRQ